MSYSVVISSCFLPISNISKRMKRLQKVICKESQRKLGGITLLRGHGIEIMNIVILIKTVYMNKFEIFDKD